MEPFEFQQKFVTQLKSSFAPNISIADELADLLKISTDSIYRRLRCQSTFSFDEVALISKKYGVSVDGIVQSDSLQVAFNFNPMYEEKSNFEKYLAWFGTYLSGIENTVGIKVIYAAEDVPLFRHFNFPHLSAFKSFYWSKAVLNNEFFIGKKFNPAIVPQEILDLNLKTYEAYSKLDSIEIWEEETLRSTLKQVEFFWDSDLFETKEQALDVMNDIRSMMNELRTDCENSAKGFPNTKGKFMLYMSEVMIGSNCVMIEPGSSGIGERVFLGHNTFNSISTYNAAFIKETRLWMDNLMKKSLLLSGTGEKQRARFFKKMDEYMGVLEKKIMDE